MNTRIKVKEHSGLTGELIFGTGRHQVEYIDPFGVKSFRTEFEKIVYRDHNIIPIGGYQFVFSKMFNIAIDQESTLRVGHLNDEAPQMRIGVPRANYKSIYYNAETGINSPVPLSVNPGVNIPAMDYVFGFMIGDGGCREDNITPIAPNYKNRQLYHAVPFRMSNDGYPMADDVYYGKSISESMLDGSNIISYYVKKFDDPKPHIVHAWVTDNDNALEPVDDTVFSSTSTTPIESYTEINLSLSQYDARGYFSSADSSVRINEFALVHGWYNKDENDFECIQMLSHYCRPSIIFEEGDTIEAVYRIYAR